MKVTSFTGMSQNEGIKIFKPCKRLMIVQDYGTGTDMLKKDWKNARCRLRLENSRTAQSVEIVPNMTLSTLSEVASHAEGFTRYANVKDKDTNTYTFMGADISFIVLNSDASVDLSSDKYLELDLYDINAVAKTEVYALEGDSLDEFFCRYSKFNLSVGELQKVFTVGDNEVLVLPFDGISEVQFQTKDGVISPTFSKRELHALMDLSNDICCINSSEEFRPAITGIGAHSANSQAMFGSCDTCVIDLSPYKSFEVKRDDGARNYEFYMVDNKK